MNSSEFDRQDDPQMISSKSRLDDNHNRDDVRVDESLHDGDKRSPIAGTDISTMSTNEKLVHAINHSSFSGDRMEKDHIPRRRDHDDKSGLNSKSNTSPTSREKNATLQEFNARIKTEDGEPQDVNIIDDPPSATTGAAMSETSLHSYYTDNIAAACAATNDELASGVVPTSGSSRGEQGDNNSAENKRRQKRARHRRLPSSTEDKVVKRTFDQEVHQNPPESNAVSLVIAELQRENLALLQENAVLKQNVHHLSYMLERSLAAPPRGDISALIAKVALLQQPQALAPPIALQPHLSSLLATTAKSSLGGGSSGGFQHASDPQVASLLGIGSESSQEQQAHPEQHFRVASILSALGSNTPPSSNPLMVSSQLAGTDISSLTGGQSSSLLEQLLLGGNPAVSRQGASNTNTLGGAGLSTPSFSELQRYLMEGRGNTSLGGSLNTSHSSSRKGALLGTDEPVLGTTAANAATFSSALQSITASSAPPRQDLPHNNLPPAIRGTALTQSQSKRNKRRRKHP